MESPIEAVVYAGEEIPLLPFPLPLKDSGPIMDTQEELHAAMVAALKRDREYYDRQQAFRKETGLYYGVRDESGVIRPHADRMHAVILASASGKTLYIKDKHSKWEPFDPTGEGRYDRE